jgi:hypothetical protein
MNNMLAATVPMTIDSSVLTAAAVAGGLYILLKFWNEVEAFMDRRKEKPTPADTYQLKGDYVTRAELHQLRLEIQNHLQRQDDLLERVEAQIASNNRDAEKRAEELHKRINPVLENTGIVRGQIEAFTQSFDNFTKMIVALEGKR